MDYPITVSSRPKTITVDSDNGLHVLLMHCGTLLPHWIPKNQRKPANRPDEYPDPSDPKNKNKKPKPGPISKRDKKLAILAERPQAKERQIAVLLPSARGEDHLPRFHAARKPKGAQMSLDPAPADRAVPESSASQSSTSTTTNPSPGGTSPGTTPTTAATSSKTCSHS